MFAGVIQIIMSSNSKLKMTTLLNDSSDRKKCPIDWNEIWNFVFFVRLAEGFAWQKGLF